MTVVLFFAVLFVLILVHEWGHFIVAKKTGMRVDEFGIGFPPKLFSKKYGETVYSLNLLPIGGFVRIFGENGEEPFSPVSDEGGDGQSEASAEAGQGGAKSARSTQSRSFTSRPKWAQALVLVAGVVMNILFAWFLFTIALMSGVPEIADENNPSDNASLMVVSVVADSPADKAGIPVGAEIVGLNADQSELLGLTPTTFKDFIVEHQNESVTVTYEKGGQVFSQELLAETGLVSDDENRPAVGVTLSYTEVVKEPLHRAIVLGAQSTMDSLVAIAVGLSGLLADTVTGTADYSNIAGPVGIAGLVGDAAEFGFTSLLLFTAIISLNLAVINLLPIPALDGGRLVFVAVEAITRKEIPAVWMMRVNVAGFAFLMILMLLVTYGDIAKLL